MHSVFIACLIHWTKSLSHCSGLGTRIVAHFFLSDIIVYEWGTEWEQWFWSCPFAYINVETLYHEKAMVKMIGLPVVSAFHTWGKASILCLKNGSLQTLGCTHLESCFCNMEWEKWKMLPTCFFKGYIIALYLGKMEFHHIDPNCIEWN